MGKRIKYTWQMISEREEVDFKDLYNRRRSGASWLEISREVGMNETSIKKLVREWCADNDIDPKTVDRANLVFGIIDDPKNADAGRVMALRKAGWSLYDIAVDCHCTEECVREVLHVTQ